MTTPITHFASDSADALLPLRRTRTVCWLILILILLAQLTVFFLVRYDVIELSASAAAATEIAPAAPSAEEVAESVASPGAQDGWRLATALAVAVAGILPLIVLGLSVVTLMVQVSGRLLGQARTASSFGWLLLAVVLLIPWQAVLERQLLCGAAWTWPELLAADSATPQDVWAQIVFWGRYVALPVLAIVVATIGHAKVAGGVKYALNEADDQVETTLPPEVA